MVKVQRRPFITVNGIVIIPLTQGFATIIDEDDLPKLKPYPNWQIHKCTDNEDMFYARASVHVSGKDGKVLLHRLIAGAVGKLQVDHIDGDGLNNRKSNLRLCTATENLRNIGPKAGRRYKGTSFARSRVAGGVGRTKPWMAQIVVNRKSIYLGYHETEELAALAYNEAAIKYHGDFAYLNEVAA